MQNLNNEVLQNEINEAVILYTSQQDFQKNQKNINEKINIIKNKSRIRKLVVYLTTTLVSLISVLLGWNISYCIMYLTIMLSLIIVYELYDERKIKRYHSFEFVFNNLRKLLSMPDVKSRLIGEVINKIESSGNIKNTNNESIDKLFSHILNKVEADEWNKAIPYLMENIDVFTISYLMFDDTED